MTVEPFVVVFGATGQQGGGCVDALLQQGKFKIKAVTRNANSDAAKSLKDRKVDVISADLNDKESLLKVCVVHRTVRSHSTLQWLHARVACRLSQGRMVCSW